jgi:hypothetical protein
MTLEEFKMDEQKIREAAYRLWDKQGRPQGQDLEHWFTAEKLEVEEDANNATTESMISSEDPDLAEENFAGAGDQKEEEVK